jgi:hypothetical protein
MSDRLLRPTATKMATISLGKAAAATQRESKNSTIQPPKPSRAAVADEVCKWIGENPPDRSRDINISTRHPPHRYESAHSSWMQPSGSTKCPADDGSSLEPLAPSPGRILERSEESLLLAQSPRPPKNDRGIRVDLPPPRREGEGHIPRGIITPSPGSQNYSRFEQWDSGPAKECLPTQESTEPTAGEDINDKTHTWRRISEVTIQICNRQEKKTQQQSKATEKIALLRRCFFPRRDVIRWTLLYKLLSQRWYNISLRAFKKSLLLSYRSRKAGPTCVGPIVVWKLGFLGVRFFPSCGCGNIHSKRGP